MEALRSNQNTNLIYSLTFVSILLMKWKPYEESFVPLKRRINSSFNPSYEMEALRSLNQRQHKQSYNRFKSFL